ncbi:MAG: hypothetical protein GY950_25095, partial [bacterium]|nr:hypothetical protein [bacterium]
KKDERIADICHIYAEAAKKKDDIEELWIEEAEQKVRQMDKGDKKDIADIPDKEGFTDFDDFDEPENN